MDNMMPKKTIPKHMDQWMWNSPLNPDFTKRLLYGRKSEAINVRVMKEYREQPLYFCANLLRNVNEFVHDEEVDFYYDEKFYRNGLSSIYIKLVIGIDRSRYLISFDDLSVELLTHSEDDQVNIPCEYEIENIDYIKSKISLSMELNIEDLNPTELGKYIFRVRVQGRHIPTNKEYPFWIDEFVKASIYAKKRDYKLALFFSFLSLYSFLEQKSKERTR